MKDFLLRVVGNSAVRKAFYALVLAALTALGVSFGTGCGASSLPPAVAKAQERLECQVAAFESVLPHEVAYHLVMAVRSGNYEYAIRQLLDLGLTPEDIEKAADAFDACSTPALVRS